MKRIISVLILTIYIFILLSGCYDSREVDEQTYIIALGIDEGKSNNLRMTLQYALPLAMGGGGSGGGSSSSQPITSLTLECASVYAGLNMANNFVGKQLNLAHAKVMVFSEEVAREGKAGMLVRAIIRSREFRPNMFIAVARGSAKDYLESIKPVQEADPAKYYDLKFDAYKYTGFTANTQMFYFYINEESNAMQPVATLVGVNKKSSTDEFNANESDASSKGRTIPFEGDYFAGNLPKVGDIKGETMGLAVFDGARMVGEVDGESATYHLMLTGSYRTSNITFLDPLKNKYLIIVSMKQSRKPQCKVDIADGNPKINVNILLEADYLSIQSGLNYNSDKLRIQFEQYAESELKKGITAYLNMTAGQFKSDVCGFGRFVKGKFLTWDEWKNYKWLEKYKNSSFDVNVDVKMRRPGLMVKDSPIVSSEGEALVP